MPASRPNRLVTHFTSTASKPWSFWLPLIFLPCVAWIDHLLDGRYPLILAGTLDELGHWLTAAILALALKAMRVPLAMWFVLIGAFVIDLDHFPHWEGIIGPVTGTSRTGFHSLLTVWIVLLLAAIASDRGALMLRSVGFGMATHLFRDMATGTVPLLWPIRDTLISFSYNAYLWMLAGAIAIAVTHATAESIKPMLKRNK